MADRLTPADELHVNISPPRPFHSTPVRFFLGHSMCLSRGTGLIMCETWLGGQQRRMVSKDIPGRRSLSPPHLIRCVVFGSLEISKATRRRVQAKLHFYCVAFWYSDTTDVSIIVYRNRLFARVSTRARPLPQRCLAPAAVLNYIEPRMAWRGDDNHSTVGHTQYKQL